MGNSKPGKSKLLCEKENKCQCSERLNKGTKLVHDKLFPGYCIWVLQPGLKITLDTSSTII